MKLCGKDTAVYLGMLVASITLVSAIVGPQISQGAANDLKHDEEIKELYGLVTENTVNRKIMVEGFSGIIKELKDMQKDNANFRKEVQTDLAEQRLLICSLGRC